MESGAARFPPVTGNLTVVNAAEQVREDESTMAVRRYLEFVADPESARDEDLIASLEARVAGETDVIARLRLLSDLDRAKQVDGTELLEGFVKHGRAWAGRNQITVGALRSVGVSPVVLAEAGFDLGHGSIHDRAARRPQPSAPRAPSSAPSRQRPSGSNIAGTVVKDWARQQPGMFTMAEAMVGTGASLMTVKKAITELVEEVALLSHGHIARPGVRGRAPEHFSVKRQPADTSRAAQQ